MQLHGGGYSDAYSIRRNEPGMRMEWASLARCHARKAATVSPTASRNPLNRPFIFTAPPVQPK
jgi:hypothetical protein